jgi:2'-5' RNA ligase
MRLFISIEIPDAIKNNIEKLIKELGTHLTPIKWVDKKNLHLTIKFLGEVDGSRIEELKGLTKESIGEMGKLSISIKGIGVFPDSMHPRMIWVGLGNGLAKVREVSQKVEKLLSSKGFREEENEFTPHLAIGRIKSEINIISLKRFMDENKDMDLGSFDAENLSIVKSTLKPTGPVYEIIGQVKL